MAKLEFGKVQLGILKILWERKRITAWEITEIMTARSGRRVAHSSVQTHLRELEKNKAIGHDIDNRTFVFYPIVKREDVMHHAYSELVEQMFSGSVAGLVSYIVNNNKVAPEELKEIQEMLKKADDDTV